MSRSDVLVDADWVGGASRRPRCRARRGRRGHQRLRQGAHPRARSRSTGRRTCRTRSAVTSWTRPASRRCCPNGASRNDDTVVLYGGNNNWFAAYAYWYFRLYGHHNVQLLDGGRKKWELDSRELDHATCPSAPRTSYMATEQDASIRAMRDEVVAAIGSRTWSTSARLTSSAASCSRPRTCRRSRRSGPVTSRPRATSRGRRRPTRTARSSPTTSSRRSTPTAGLDFGKRHHRLLPDRRALRAHLVRAARAARPGRT